MGEDGEPQDAAGRRLRWVPNGLPEIVCGLGLVAWIVAVRWRRPADGAIVYVLAIQVIAWNNLLTLPHEIGHALAARLLGGRVRPVHLGSGPRLGVVHVLGIPWHVHLGIGGHSYSDDVIACAPGW